jgi:hypothetical protein
MRCCWRPCRCNPGQSIQAAVNTANAGDTVRVLAGTYAQKVLISGKSGTASAFITLKADPNVIISGSGLSPSGREGLITIRNSNYVRVEGFDVTGLTSSGSNTPVGILIEGNGSKLQIVNNKIHGIKNTSTCKDPCSVGAHGLAVFGTNATGVTDLLVQGNEVYQNVLQASEALVINGNVDRFEVLSNNVHDNNNIGFDFIGYEGECSGCGESDRVRNGMVRDNVAKNNSSVTNPWYGGEGSAGGFYVDGGRNIIFDRNISTGNDIGFEFASEHSGKATEDILMTNNFVYANREAGLSLGGYSSGAGQARRINIHNNAFYKNMGWGTEVVFQYKVIDSRFSNNIAPSSLTSMFHSRTSPSCSRWFWRGISTRPAKGTGASKLIVSAGCGRGASPRTAPAHRCSGRRRWHCRIGPAAGRGAQLLHDAGVEQHRAQRLGGQRGLRREGGRGHVVEHRAAQLARDRARRQLALQVEGGHHQPPRPDLRLEQRAELVVAVPVVDRLHDGLQAARQAVQVHGARAVHQFGPLPVEVRGRREARQRRVLVVDQQAQHAAPARIHQPVPEHGHVGQRRRGPVQVGLARHVEHLAAFLQARLGGVPGVRDQHAGRRRGGGGVGIDPEVPVVRHFRAGQADGQRVLARRRQRRERRVDAAQRGVLADRDGQAVEAPFEHGLAARVLDAPPGLRLRQRRRAIVRDLDRHRRGARSRSARSASGAPAAPSRR